MRDFPIYRDLKDGSSYYLHHSILGDYEVRNVKRTFKCKTIFSSRKYSEARQKLEELRYKKHLEWDF